MNVLPQVAGQGKAGGVDPTHGRHDHGSSSAVSERATTTSTTNASAGVGRREGGTDSAQHSATAAAAGANESKNSDRASAARSPDATRFNYTSLLEHRLNVAPRSNGPDVASLMRRSPAGQRGSQRGHLGEPTTPVVATTRAQHYAAAGHRYPHDSRMWLPLFL